MHFILEFSWLQWGLIALALVGLYLMRKRIRRLHARLMKPSRDRKARWLSLATVADVNMSTDGVKASTLSLTESMVNKMLDRLVGKLPMVISNDLIDRVVAGLPNAIEEHVRERVSSLAKQVADLRKERDELTTGGWHNIGVHLRGLKLTEDDDKKYFAIVQIQPRTGKLRAHPVKDIRCIVREDLLWRTDYYGSSKSPFRTLGLESASSLGAPWYGKVNGNADTIVMLDEAYTLLK